MKLQLRTGLVLRLWLALALVIVVAACGGPDPVRSILSPPKVGHELDGLPSLATLSATRLPPAPTRESVERAFLIALFGDIQSVWRRDFTTAHERYRAAKVVVFDSVVHSGCGKQDDSGPFYCPADDTVYLDLRFFSMLLAHHGVGAAAQAYIVGHELGHHVQRLTGVANHVSALNRGDPAREKARSVQVELQADCLAGVWGRSAYPRSEFSINDLYDALKTADVIGDDYLQQAAGSIVDPSLFTHGSSEQRRTWLRTGYKSSRPGACDTFTAG